MEVILAVVFIVLLIAGLIFTFVTRPTGEDL